MRPPRCGEPLQCFVLGIKVRGGCTGHLASSETIEGKALQPLALHPDLALAPPLCDAPPPPKPQVGQALAAYLDAVNAVRVADGAHGAASKVLQPLTPHPDPALIRGPPDCDAPLAPQTPQVDQALAAYLDAVDAVGVADSAHDAAAKALRAAAANEYNASRNAGLRPRKGVREIADPEDLVEDYEVSGGEEEEGSEEEVEGEETGASSAAEDYPPAWMEKVPLNLRAKVRLAREKTDAALTREAEAKAAQQAAWAEWVRVEQEVDLMIRQVRMGIGEWLSCT